MESENIRNTTDTDNSEPWELDETPKGFLAFIYCSYILVGSCGNLFTILALLQSKKLRVEVATKFVISLAISDLLMCSIILPLNLFGLFNDDEKTITYEAVYGVIYFGIIVTSMCNILAITINRYIIICHNAIYDKIYSPLIVTIMISILWLFSFGISIWVQFGEKDNMGSSISHCQKVNTKKAML